MPVLKEAQLKKQIASKEFANFYVLYGEEKLLVRHYTDLLIEKLVDKQSADLCLHTFDNDSQLEEIANAVNTLPFMGGYNCVTISDYDFEAMKADDLKALTKLLSDIPDTTVVIISMPTLEQDAKKLGKFKKIIDIVGKNGVVAEFNRKTLLELERQLAVWVNKRGCSITQACCSKIVDYCGNDLVMLKNELDKLCAYADGAEITPEMVEMLVTKNLEARIYDLSDSVIAGNGDKAFRQLDTLFYHKEKARSIVTVLAYAYIDMYRARVASESGEPMKTIADAFNYKNRAFVLDKSRQKSRKISTAALRRSIDAIINAMVTLTSTSVGERLTAEKLVAQLVLIANEG